MDGKESSPLPPAQPEGEDPDGVRWDGSEAQMVEDEDAHAFDEDLTGVQIRFTLTQEELYRGFLQRSLRGGDRFLRGVLCVLLAASAVAGFSQGLAAAGPWWWVLCAAACCVLAGLLLQPRLQSQRKARSCCDNRETVLKIYPDEIALTHGSYTETLPLDAAFARDRCKGLLLLYCDGCLPMQDGLLVLPLHSVEPGVLPDVEAIIRSGTHRAR